MNRYLKAFIISFVIYILLIFFIFYEFNNKIVVIPPSNQKDITKISLNNISIVKNNANFEEVKKEKRIHKKPIEKIKEDNKSKRFKKKTEKIKDELEPVKKVEESSSSSLNQSQILTIEEKYLAEVRRVIEKNKVYPKVALKLKQTGKVHISFTILRNGEIKNIKIIKKSAFANLDKASIELLYKIGSFNPLPDEIKRRHWNLDFPIEYSIN